MKKQPESASKTRIQLSRTELIKIEETLGESITGFASELRLTEAADFVTFIRIGQMANLRNIVHSSAEMHFKQGTLELAELGEAEFTWTGPPAIILPMKFKHAGISVYFKLRLAALCATVDVLSVDAEHGSNAYEELSQRFRLALQEARATGEGERRLLFEE
jgi:hypothetical protein